MQRHGSDRKFLGPCSPNAHPRRSLRGELNGVPSFLSQAQSRHGRKKRGRHAVPSNNWNNVSRLRDVAACVGARMSVGVKLAQSWPSRSSVTLGIATPVASSEVGLTGQICKSPVIAGPFGPMNRESRGQGCAYGSSRMVVMFPPRLPRSMRFAPNRRSSNGTTGISDWAGIGFQDPGNKLISTFARQLGASVNKLQQIAIFQPRDMEFASSAVAVRSR